MKPYNEDKLLLPFDEILSNNGYIIKREKSSKNSITMTNANNDTIIITRFSNGHYLYFNPNELNDRGNIYSFCKNRGIKLKELLAHQTKEVNLKHTLEIKSSQDNKIKELLECFNQSKALGEDNIFANKRMIDKNLLQEFNLKQDDLHNVLVPSFSLKNIKDEKLILQSGFVKYLSSPITKDKQGNEYKKPIKQLCYGLKGLELLKAEKLRMSDIKEIIIAESIIDALSFVELKHLHINECLLCSTNGQITGSCKELIQHLNENCKNASFNLVFDNDEKGKSFTQTLKELLGEKALVSEPVLKDFNDDLFVSKFLLLNRTFTLKELETSLDEKLFQKIITLKTANKDKELKLPLKILKLIKPKIQNFLNKESLEKLSLAFEIKKEKGFVNAR
ncbi:toprim domain-containing protein [Campylobacter sp. MIT 97-5078]|uniref:toprim domain-containing protein n=1 Tax=Campylobacter sp. MIT 97-5078 TaxID=1548153 RepID=UPI000512C9F7|nr:toprim domain-containing protein [Campylobacter sp. MIT 97-5078]KGI55304.1 hypothetical protein LR59_12655 [Campylobacter sp. MIT 97-5078]TQR25570.1 DUF3991 domain-containing protein [Campylobacter sp. MIT 97-5078]